MVQAAGELADGVVTWLAGPRSLGEVIVPRLHAAAAGRPTPRVVAALPVAVCADADLARRQAGQVFTLYGRFDNYRRLFEREGVASPGEVALVGTESDIERQLKSMEDLGVTELWPVLFPAGADPDATVERTRALLAGLSRP
jgi:alkanesulfonate monooxygenase SsuD/methylene tetrahydromethanopterin reductase-like flavin-dependent oxidoreductase (luciferase family)